MLIAILVFVMFAGGTAVLVKQTNGRSRGRAGASRSRARGSRSGASRSGSSRSGGSTRSGGSSGRGAGRAGGSARSGSARGSYQSGRRPSRAGTWFLKAWNSSGAPKTSESTLSGASAVVTGKAAGALSRGGWWVTKRTGRAGKWFAGRAMIPFDRWLERKHAGLESAAALNGTPGGENPTPVHADVTHDENPRSASERKLLEFKLRTKEQWLKDTIAAFEKHQAENPGDLTPEDIAEHMKTRRRYETEINELRHALSGSNPATTPPPVFVNPNQKSSKGERMNRSAPTAAAPATLAAHLNHINDFEPESDADLLNFMGAEVAGKAAEAEAYMELFDRCVSGHGLDPQAMQGVSDYSEAIAESAEAMKRAHQQFVSVYEAIIAAANNGTVMPHDGRFFSGEANVA